jgi:hypothetical protein
MDSHIVPNLTQQTKSVKARHNHASLHDWHFEATLFGAGMLLLLLPLAPSLIAPQRTKQVLGATTQQVSSQRVYDSEYGYYQIGGQDAENKNLFSSIIDLLQPLLK